MFFPACPGIFCPPAGGGRVPERFRNETAPHGICRAAHKRSLLLLVQPGLQPAGQLVRAGGALGTAADALQTVDRLLRSHANHQGRDPLEVAAAAAQSPGSRRPGAEMYTSWSFSPFFHGITGLAYHTPPQMTRGIPPDRAPEPAVSGRCIFLLTISIFDDTLFSEEYRYSSMRR